VGARAACLASFLVFGVSCGGMAAAVEPEWADWYPADIAPPAGTRYPCALEALPRDLPGVPEDDRRFVNHVYTLVLRATQAKLVLMRDAEQADARAAFLRYEESLGGLRQKLAEEAPPPGLERFKESVSAAFEQQYLAFSAAVAAAPEGANREVFARPEARRASKLLIRAWGEMNARYRSAPRELRDSLYHHLCALDLF